MRHYRMALQNKKTSLLKQIHKELDDKINDIIKVSSFDEIRSKDIAKKIPSLLEVR